MLSNKLCNDDKQCNNNYMCSFDEQKLNHSCQKLNQNNLYLGCLDNDYNNFEYISSNISNHHDNFKNCLDFSRKQVNKDGLNHNYLLYKKKKNHLLICLLLIYIYYVEIKILLHYQFKIILILNVILITKIVNLKQKNYYLTSFKQIK